MKQGEPWLSSSGKSTLLSAKIPSGNKPQSQIPARLYRPINRPVFSVLSVSLGATQANKSRGPIGRFLAPCYGSVRNPCRELAALSQVPAEPQEFLALQPQIASLPSKLSFPSQENALRGLKPLSPARNNRQQRKCQCSMQTITPTPVTTHQPFRLQGRQVAFCGAQSDAAQ
jgi:hypothetical protein